MFNEAFWLKKIKNKPIITGRINNKKMMGNLKIIYLTSYFFFSFFFVFLVFSILSQDQSRVC